MTEKTSMIEVVLKPCPWCDKTAELCLPYNGETWIWTVACKNYDCMMKPVSPHVSIRKTTKKNFEAICKKLEALCERWNKSNPRIAREMKLVDLSKIGIKLNFNYRVESHV